MKFLRRLIFPLSLLLIFFACKKDEFTDSSSARLQTNVDTLHFDTVFTTTGSFTQFFKIFNNNDKGIRVSSVRLAGGTSSPFKINVDGTPGPIVNDIEIAANDSAYVFVTVQINPSTANLAFIVTDSIEINYNGNRTWVQLDAYGQNANFLRSAIITGTQTWSNDLPYVILGGLTVDTTATLLINEGTKVYLHADAPFIVNGTLQVRGQKWDSTRVVFTGDRLDQPYRDFPASFPGIIFTDVSKDNLIEYGIIKNAYQGIIVDRPASNGLPKLTLRETIIDNAYDAGILALRSGIVAENVLISNCGQNLLIADGGDYSFSHCTIASFSNSYVQHKKPVAYIGNYLNQTSAPNNLTAVFTNCIFWGEGGLIENEVVTDKKGSTVFDLRFDNVLWRVKTEPANAIVTGNKIIQDPEFDSVYVSLPPYNFRLKETSPAIDKGRATSITKDLDGATRPVGLPDLGAYEKQ